MFPRKLVMQSIEKQTRMVEKNLNTRGLQEARVLICGTWEPIISDQIKGKPPRESRSYIAGWMDGWMDTNNTETRSFTGYPESGETCSVIRRLSIERRK